jgi:hypothetical protein
VDTGQRTGSQPAALSEPARRRRLIPRRPHWLAVVEAGIAAALLVATFFVHNTSYLLSTPFWNDEEWVAISTKLPLHDLARDSASTPLGWGLLLRLMVFGGQQRYRLVPLAFAGLGAVAAYALARSLPWRSRWVAISAATLAGVVTLFAPSSLVRDDLKQYTSDAFVTLILLWLLARLEANWSARRFSQLLVAVVLGFLFSAPAAFVGAAVLLSYGLVCLIKGQWRRFAIVAGSSLLAGGALGLIYLFAYRPGIPPGLGDYWNAYYLPVHHGWGPSLRFLNGRLQYLTPYVGIKNAPAMLALFVLGVGTLAWLKRPAVAMSVPLLLAEMILVSALRVYPFGDERTSHFLLIAMAAVGTIGVAGVCALLSRLHVSVSVVAATAAAVVFVVAVHTYIRIQRIPFEDLRSPARYVAANRGPGDIVLLSSLSGWGFSYYWPNAHPTRVSTDSNLQGFTAKPGGLPDVIEASDRTEAPIAHALAQALADLRKNGPTSRIWLVREHVTVAEEKAWETAFRRYHVDPDSIDGTRLMVITED